MDLTPKHSFIFVLEGMDLDCLPEGRFWNAQFDLKTYDRPNRRWMGLEFLEKVLKKWAPRPLFRTDQFLFPDDMARVANWDVQLDRDSFNDSLNTIVQKYIAGDTLRFVGHYTMLPKPKWFANQSDYKLNYISYIPKLLKHYEDENIRIQAHQKKKCLVEVGNCFHFLWKVDDFVRPSRPFRIPFRKKELGLFFEGRLMEIMRHLKLEGLLDDSSLAIVGIPTPDTFDFAPQKYPVLISKKSNSDITGFFKALRGLSK